MFIYRDDEFESPIYEDGDLDEVDAEVRETLFQGITDALSNDGAATNVELIGDLVVGWHCLVRSGLSFVCIAEAEEDVVGADEVAAYLAALVQRYVDEVDESRYPSEDGVADVLVDVIPPWED